MLRITAGGFEFAARLEEAAAPSASLVALLIVFGAAALVVVPALALLFRLHQRSLLDEEGA